MQNQYHLNEINFYEQFEAQIMIGKLWLESMLADVTKKLGGSGGKRDKKVSLRNRVEENRENTEKDKMTV